MDNIAVNQGAFSQTYYYRRMQTFDPEDRLQIRRRILQVYGSSYKFNFFLSISTRDAVKAIRDLPDELELHRRRLSRLCWCRPDKYCEELEEDCNTLKQICISCGSESRLAVGNWREKWQQDLRFRAGAPGSDSCIECCWPRAGHFGPEGRCYRPDEPNPLEWWRYCVPLPRT
jgi:hypothetical protein